MRFFAEWFQIQKEFTSLFEEISLQQLEKCFYADRQENVTDVRSQYNCNRWQQSMTKK